MKTIFFCHREYKKNIDNFPGPLSTVHLVPEAEKKSIIYVLFSKASTHKGALI